MARTLTQGDINSWAKLTDYWTPLRVLIANSAAASEKRFAEATRGGRVKAARFHEHYWTVEQIEKDLDEAGYVIVEKAEMDRLKALESEAAMKAASPLVTVDAGDSAPQPKRRGRPPKVRPMQQGAEE